jgi:hypothetical protein
VAPCRLGARSREGLAATGTIALEAPLDFFTRRGYTVVSGSVGFRIDHAPHDRVRRGERADELEPPPWGTLWQVPREPSAGLGAGSDLRLHFCRLLDVSP